MLTHWSDTPALRRRLPALAAPPAHATDFTSIGEAARAFGRCFHDAGAAPEEMVIALKAALATSYGATPSLADADDAIANVHHVVPAAQWYPLALASALDGFFVD